LKPVATLPAPSSAVTVKAKGTPAFTPTGWAATNCVATAAPTTKGAVVTPFSPPALALRE
jgi:hypothetical protein